LGEEDTQIVEERLSGMDIAVVAGKEASVLGMNAL